MCLLLALTNVEEQQQAACPSGGQIPGYQHTLSAKIRAQDCLLGFCRVLAVLVAWCRPAANLVRRLGGLQQNSQCCHLSVKASVT